MTAVMKQDELPDFEGEKVEGALIRITNAGDGLTEALEVAPRALHRNDIAYFLIRGKVDQVNHKTAKATKYKDERVVRVHTIVAEAATEIEDEYAKKILMAAADNLARRKAEIEGQEQINFTEGLEGAETVAEMHERKAAASVPEAAFSGPPA